MVRQGEKGHEARGRQVTRWRLFIDESGRFDRPEDEVCVAGLLIRADVPGSDPVQIRHALQQAAPDLPWPMKASEMNRPVVFALAHCARCPADGRREGGSLLHEIVDALRTRDAEAVDGALRAISQAERLDIEVIARLDGFARADTRRYARLREIADTAITSIGRLIRVLAHGGDEGLHVLLVACGETVRGGSAEASDEESARYLGQLRGVILRAGDVVARLEGRQQIDLYVLGRHVSDEILGTPVRMPLHYKHVVPVAQAVERTLAGHGTPRVAIRFFEVAKYDDRMHAALVLADFVSNRVRRSLQQSSRSLADIERMLLYEVPCSVRTGLPPASHLAAAGWAQDEIERARSGGNADRRDRPPETREWAVEQAGEWCGILRR